MKIIMLAGDWNTGKTTALNRLYKQLTSNGTRNIIERRKSSKAENEDFECVVKFKDKTVAIFSWGDVYREVVKAIVRYAHHDVLIIAYRTRFAAELDTEVRKNKHHCVIRKKTRTDPDCERVIKEIRKQL